MHRVYEPSKKVFIASAVGILISVSLMYSAVLMSNDSNEARWKGLLLFVPFTVYIILLFFTNIDLSDGQIRVIALAIFRHTANISEITSINYRSKMLGGTDVVEVHYRPSSGIDKKMSFTINAYGPQQAREIIDHLVKKNPAIKVDSRIYKCL